MKLWKQDWDWEALDAYRDEEPKDRKLWLWGLALVCGGLSVYAMYLIESRLYAHAISTNWASWLGAFLGTFIGLRIARAMGREDAYEKWSKKKKLAIWGVTAALILFYLWICRNKPNLWVVGMQFLVWLPVSYVTDFVLKKKMSRYAVNAWSYILIYVCIAMATFAAPKILGMTSVAEGEKLLQSEGYQGVYFETRAMPYWLGEEMAEQVDKNRPKEMEREYVYLYGGAKDGKSYGILVDPYGHGILAEKEALPGTQIYDWLD